MPAQTYRAIQVTEAKKLELVQRPIPKPPAGKVRIRLEACGICHTDSFTVEGLFPALSFPRVPGHEVVGKIDALGDGVSGWTIGQRVGVGFQVYRSIIQYHRRSAEFSDLDTSSGSGLISLFLVRSPCDSGIPYRES
jgi:NADPH:quinone reductase-like Zn-dependent oxidoreductase